MNTNRRLFLRHGFPGRAFVCLLDEHNEPVAAETCRARDVSFGGLSLRVAMNPPLDSIVLLEFERHNDGPLILAGKVRHVGPLDRNGYTMGVRFVTPETDLDLPALVSRARSLERVPETDPAPHAPAPEPTFEPIKPIRDSA